MRFLGQLGTLDQTISRLARKSGGIPNEGSIEQAVRLRVEFFRSRLSEGNSSLPILDSLREMGVRLALVSDASDETVRAWPSSQLSSRFDVSVFSCVEGARKPDARLYRRAREQLGLEAAQCIFVGDGGSRELSGAEAVGIRAFRYVFPEPGYDTFRLDFDVEWKGSQLEELGELTSGRAWK